LLDLARSFVGIAPVAAARRVIDRYGNAGGGLLAGGLAYAALFAIVPAILLAAGLTGVLLHDSATRTAVVDSIASVLPPLGNIVSVVLGEASLDAAPVSILGFVVLLWGASRFVVAFQEAIGRVMGGDRRRSLLRRNVAALAAVLLVIGAIVLGTIAAGLTAFLDAGQAGGIIAVVDAGLSLVLGVVPVVATFGAVALVYRLVPLPGPRWRSLGLPAVAAGLALTIFARIFVFVAPRLIGAAALLGTLASVFAALAWLSLSFQALLLGAAWTADREARARAS
jgi:membrane protein